MPEFAYIQYSFGKASLSLVEDLEDFLKLQGITLLFSEIQENTIQFFIQTEHPLQVQDLEYMKVCPIIGPYTLEENVDWTEQARLFSSVDSLGRIEVSLSDFGIVDRPCIYIYPTMAFGDPSQPTTSLMLQFLPKYVKNAYVVDIGAGSAILSLSSICFGANKALGIEIDSEAIGHAKENVILNNMQDVIEIIDNKRAIERFVDTKDTVVVLCNMISSEQKIAFAEYKALLDKADILIASGVLVKEKASYLRFLSEFQFEMIEEKIVDQWIGLACHKQTRKQ